MRVREQENRRCSFVFFGVLDFFNLSFLCFNTHPPMGVVVINNTAKLNPLNDKVKFYQCRLLTVVFTFFYFFVVHILWIRNFVYIWVYQNTKHHDYEKFKCIKPRVF